MATELKPCPFCGGEADFRTENFGATVWVKCVICGVSTSRYDTNLIVCGKGGKDWAIEAWNRRVEKTPCDLCKFNPPSSMDGKPCTMCVADGMAEDGK